MDGMDGMDEDGSWMMRAAELERLIIFILIFLITYYYSYSA